MGVFSQNYELIIKNLRKEDFILQNITVNLKDYQEKLDIEGRYKIRLIPEDDVFDNSYYKGSSFDYTIIGSKEDILQFLKNYVDYIVEEQGNDAILFLCKEKYDSSSENDLDKFNIVSHKLDELNKNNIL